MTFQSGQSGNPTGRPRSRGMTRFLEQVGDEIEGIRIGKETKGFTKKELLAKIVWQLALEGEAVLPNGTVKTIAGRDHFDLIKWMYTHVDGPPKIESQNNDVEDPASQIGIDIARLTPEAQAARVAKLLESARARAAQSVDSESPEG